MGMGARALGLAGEVDADAFGALIAGRDPNSGEALRESTGRDRVCALDLTFSAPESVGVLFAVGDRGTSGALVNAHEEAVAAAVGYLEREACVVRRGRGGRVELAAEGFVAAAYRHWMSGAGQPQLHTACGGGGPRTRAGGPVVGASRLPRLPARQGGRLAVPSAPARPSASGLAWAQWGPVRNGMAELEGVPAGVLAHFSRRRAEIVEWLESEDRSGQRSAEKAALATREPKGRR
jgi:hypothetical protein